MKYELIRATAYFNDQTYTTVAASITDERPADSDYGDYWQPSITLPAIPAKTDLVADWQWYDESWTAQGKPFNTVDLYSPSTYFYTRYYPATITSGGNDWKIGVLDDTTTSKTYTVALQADETREIKWLSRYNGTAELGTLLGVELDDYSEEVAYVQVAITDPDGNNVATLSNYDSPYTLTATAAGNYTMVVTRASFDHNGVFAIAY